MEELVNQAPTDAEIAGLTADDQRTDLGDRPAQGRQLRAREDLITTHGDDEAVRVHDDLATLARQKVSLSEVLDDQLVNGRCFVRAGRAERDRIGIGDRGSGIKSWQFAIKNGVVLDP